MNKDLLRIAQEQLQQAQKVMVISHIRPDGDAIGSLIGLGLSLQRAGKEVQMVSVDGVPSTYHHLPGREQVVNKPKGTFDLIATVDCADLGRLGAVFNERIVPDLNIDHHPTNTYFARTNLVDTEAVATAEILAETLSSMNFLIDQEVATNLLTGIITDTLGFRTFNLTPKALRTAATLMESGADLPFLYHRALIQRPFEAVRFWAAGLSQLKREDRIVWTSLSQEDRKAAGYSGKDDADLVNILTSINDVDIVLIFVEQPNGKVKVSWRARPGYDVAQIATQYGGGGHTAAAGAEIDGTLDQVQEKVLRTTRNLMR
jgi:bifunctional oligoribonuclease and PAP phosphatase NrnA